MPANLKLLWYAFILLRKEGIPCVFWGDLFGTQGPHAEEPIGHKGKDSEAMGNSYSNALTKLMLCRKHYALGEQVNYRQSPIAIGWARAGEETGNGCAVVLSAAMALKSSQTVKMRVGEPGEVWVDVMGYATEEITIDTSGIGAFPVGEAGVGVWVRKGNGNKLELTSELDGNI